MLFQWICIASRVGGGINGGKRPRTIDRGIINITGIFEQRINHRSDRICIKPGRSVETHSITCFCRKKMAGQRIVTCINSCYFDNEVFHHIDLNTVIQNWHMQKVSGIADTVSRLRPAENVINFRKKTPAMETRRIITNALTDLTGSDIVINNLCSNKDEKTPPKAATPHRCTNKLRNCSPFRCGINWYFGELILAHQKGDASLARSARAVE